MNLIIAVIFSLILYQIIQLTIIRQSTLKEVAARQHSLTVKIAPQRGPILDRNGKEFAINLKVPSVYAVPRLIGRRERASLASKVSNLLSLEESFVMERMSRDKAFVWLRRRVSAESAMGIKQLKQPALGILEESRRFYPQGELLAHILGFTNIDGQGLEGIELALTHELEGRQGRRLTKRDALGNEIRAFETKHIPAVNGNRVILTIDHYLQYLTERALQRAFDEWKAKGGSAILMEVDTGRILAMANRPGFDPNDISASSKESRRNRAVTDMYEPGSVFKIVALSAVLNEDAAAIDTTFFCENGEYRYGSHVLHDTHPYGDLSLTDVIVKSSNIGTVKMAALLDPDIFQRYIDLFGFGKRTGIDFPGEAEGFTRPPSKWSKTSPYNIPIGHEVLVTPIQMLRAMTVIANGGHLVRPYLVDRIEDQAGVLLRKKEPEITSQIIRRDVIEDIRVILTKVVESGTGKRAQIEGVLVAGKTGTAQKVLPNGKGYSHDNFVSSFVGFAPAEDPRLAMIVVLDDPGPKYYGGTVAAPVFKEVMESALLHIGVIKGEPKGDQLARMISGLQESQPISQ